MIQRTRSITSLLLVGAMVATSLSPVYAASKFNLNQADVKSWQALKGIGSKTAQAIIDYRKQHGDYQSLKQLSAVRGLTAKRIAKIQTDNNVDFIAK